MKALKDTRTKIGLGILVLILAVSLSIKPDKEFKMEGVTIAKKPDKEVDLEQLRKEDEEYRKQAMDPNYRAKVLAQRKKAQKNSRESKKPTNKKQTTRKKTFAELEKELALKKAAEKKQKEAEEKKTQAKQKFEEKENKKAKLEAEKKKEQEIAMAKKPEALIFQAKELRFLEPSSKQNINTTPYHLVVKNSPYYKSKILVNREYAYELNDQNNDFYAFSIPYNSQELGIEVEICFTHLNASKRRPAAAELVRAELLNLNSYPEEEKVLQLTRFHPDALKVILSPMGFQHEAGKEDCQSVSYFFPNN